MFLIASPATMSTAGPYSGFASPVMIPGISRNWRLTSSTTRPPTRPTACMASDEKRKGIRPPMNSPAITHESSSSKVTVSPWLPSSDVKPSKRTRAARPAEPIA